jgi:hypothetical protein
VAVRIPLGLTDFDRSIAETPAIALQNRYFEQSPQNQEDQVALIARPGLRKWLTVGSGPIRGMYSQPGAFDDALFVVSGTSLYQIDPDETTTLLGTVTGTSAVSMAATDYPYKLFIANGAGLQLWDGATLAAVAVPDNDGIVSVGYIAQYVICVVAQGEDKNGRFYWIEPGESTIDALNFATAERSPDMVWSVVVIGDQFWLPGASTTEIWYLTGDGTAPFLRQQGRLFDKGVIEGTVIQVKDDVMASGADGVVYRISDQPIPVSTPGIAQRFREAFLAQRTG